MTDEAKEVLTDDGRIVVYSPDDDGEDPADTEEWMASDTTVSGGDQQ